MSRKISSYMVAGLAWLAVGHAWAQESLLSDYLDRMLTTHPAIRAKELARQSSDQLVTSAWMQFLPTPSVALDKGPANTPANGGGSHATTYRITQPIWTGGRLTAGLDAARLKREQAELDIQETALSLSLKLIGLYQNWWALDAKWNIQKRDLARLESLRDMMARRVQSGVSADIDLDLASVRVVQQQADLGQTERMLASVRGQIRELFPEDIALKSVALADVPKIRMAYDNLLERVLDISPALRKAQVAERLALVDVDLAKADASPSLSLRAERQDGSYLGSLSPTAPGKNRVYVNLQFNLGAGGSVIPQIGAASARASAATESIDVTRRDVAAQVKSDWEDYHAVLERLPRLQRAAKSASTVVDSSLRLFTSGRRSWLDLINAVREHSQSELQLVDAQAALVGGGFKINLMAGQWGRPSAPAL